MLEPKHLSDEFRDEVKRYKYRGSSGKVNLALDALPNFTCLPGEGHHLRGAISISPSIDYMERAYDDAKYGNYSRRPYIDMVIPSLTDPSIAPPGKHVMSCFVQYAPYKLKEGTWDEKREAFGDNVIDTIAEFAPNLKNIIIGRQVVTPLDLERECGLTEGNIFQGELSLEQLFFLRPVPGWAQYKTPIKNLWMCGSATHPGGGIMGAPGRLAALEILKTLQGDELAMAEDARRRHPRGRAQRAGRGVLSRQGWIQAAGSGAAARGRRLRDHRRISSRISLLQAGPQRGPIRSDIVADMGLAKHGLKTYAPDVRVLSLSPNGKPLVLLRRYREVSAGDCQVLAERCGELWGICKIAGAHWRSHRPAVGHDST